MTFFDDEVSYVHYSSAEVCDSPLFSCHGIVEWKSKDSIFGRRAVPNWCGRVLEASKVNLKYPYCTGDIPNFGVLLLSSVELAALRTFSTSVQVTGAFYHVCTFD